MARGCPWPSAAMGKKGSPARAAAPPAPPAPRAAMTRRSGAAAAAQEVAPSQPKRKATRARDDGAERASSRRAGVPASRPPVAADAKRCAAPPTTAAGSWDSFKDRIRGVVKAVEHFQRAAGPRVHAALVVIGPQNPSDRGGSQKDAWNLTRKDQRPLAVFTAGENDEEAYARYRMCTIASNRMAVQNGRVAIKIPSKMEELEHCELARELGELAPCVLLRDRASIDGHFAAKTKESRPTETTSKAVEAPHPGIGDDGSNVAASCQARAALALANLAGGHNDANRIAENASQPPPGPPKSNPPPGPPKSN